MNTSVLRVVFLSVMLAMSAPAWSVDTEQGWYVGAGAGTAWVESDEFDSDIDDDDFAWKLIVGWQFTEHFAFEGSYYDFGEQSEGNAEVDADGYGAFFVAGLPLGPVRVFAKAGALAWDVDTVGEIQGPNGPVRVTQSDETGTDLAAGVGAEIELFGLGVRAEVEYFDFVDDVYTATVGLTYAF